MDNITDGVDVRNSGFLHVIHLQFSIWLGSHTCALKVELLGEGIATDGEENGIILLGLDFTTLVVANNNLTCGVWFLKLGRNGTLNELSSMVFHVFSDSVCHILIEASQ